MTNEQLKMAQWLKSNIALLQDLTENLSLCEFCVVQVEMPPHDGHALTHAHPIRKDVRVVLIDALQKYTEKLNKEFEAL